MKNIDNPLYWSGPDHCDDRDFFEWTQRVAADLRAGHLAPADVEYVAEEIESLGKRDLRELRSRLARIFEHRLKLECLPQWVVDENRRTWQRSISDQEMLIKVLLTDSPSLRAVVGQWIPECYRQAVRRVAQDYAGVPLPRSCPWDVEELLRDIERE